MPFSPLIGFSVTDSTVMHVGQTPNRPIVDSTRVSSLRTEPAGRIRNAGGGTIGPLLCLSLPEGLGHFGLTIAAATSQGFLIDYVLSFG